MTAKIKLNAASGGGSVSLKAPSTTTGNAAVELQLPIADGTNGQVIKTNGSGVLSFGADTSGKILQVVQTVKSDTFTHSGNTNVTDVTGLNVTITPSSSSNKVLLLCFMNISNNNISRVQFVRGTTAIGIPSAAGNRPVGTASMNNGGDTNVSDPLTMIFLDSPATTSATTYKISFSNELNSSEFAVNRSQGDLNSIVGVRSISTLTAMEVSV